MSSEEIRFTPKQLQILEFIVAFTKERGFSPTLEEIAESALDRPVTKITVYEHINQLEAKGAVRRAKFKARSITVLIKLPARSNAARSRFDAFAQAIHADGYKVQRQGAKISIQRSYGGHVYFEFDEEGKLVKID